MSEEIDDRLVAGVIRSTHGVKGEVKLKSMSGSVEHLRRLKHAWLKTGDTERKVTLESVRGSPSNLIVAFRELDSLEEARKYKNAELVVLRKDASILSEGEYYVADLVGCNVFFRERLMGSVQSVWENSNCDMLEVRCENDRIVQLPLHDHYVLSINIDQRRVDLAVDWILE